MRFQNKSCRAFTAKRKNSKYVLKRCVVIFQDLRSSGKRLLHLRAVFDWVSNVNCVCFGLALLRSVIGQQSSRHFFKPMGSKTNPRCDLLACIFPRFAPATCTLGPRRPLKWLEFFVASRTVDFALRFHKC